jgi:glycosyltransferase involved in cell wall biosynthesis
MNHANNPRPGKFSAAVLYPYPMELDGVSIQGEFLYRGLKANGYNVKPCNRLDGFEKNFIYKVFRPDVAIGIGFWGDVPNLVMNPIENGIQPVPWLNADGWVANYHDILNSLPLIFTTSNWVKETYIRDGVNNRNMHPLPIGIDTDAMKPLPKDNPQVIKMREFLGVKPDEKLIFTAGGDTTSKGFQEILKALAKIGSDFTNWKYVGKSWEKGKPTYHYKEELEIIKGSKFPKGSVRYIDGAISRETLNVLLSAADIYAAPSRIEGFGMIQVEAMSCGTPVLSIDAMGCKDTIVNGKTGFLAKVGETVDLEEEWAYKSMGFDKKQMIVFDKPKTFAYRADVDDLAKHLLNLLADDGLRKKMGEASRQHVVRNFDYRKISLDMAKIIESKLGL